MAMIVPEDEFVERLVRHAIAARKFALAPFSGFHVGAALLARDGSIVTGCNVEAANFSLTTCAERVALLKALSEGVSEFTAIAVVTSSISLTPPCGSCRQLLWEYCGDIPVILASESHARRESISLSSLFPDPFGPGFLT